MEARRKTTVALSSIGFPLYCKSRITVVSDVTTVAARVVGTPFEFIILLIREREKGSSNKREEEEGAYPSGIKPHCTGTHGWSYARLLYHLHL